MSQVPSVKEAFVSSSLAPSAHGARELSRFRSRAAIFGYYLCLLL